ncbi:hypothetical protein PSE_2794 [Pseudovibrio sp. FO-BEG1]|nr:hypothetical protein PSE_2794 [Pseudovibrio sp. FO-BEG1]
MEFSCLQHAYSLDLAGLLSVLPIGISGEFLKLAGEIDPFLKVG